MNELIKKELEKNKGKTILIFLKKGFRYEGKILKVTEDAVKIFDSSRDKNFVISLDNIGTIEEVKDD